MEFIKSKFGLMSLGLFGLGLAGILLRSSVLGISFLAVLLFVVLPKLALSSWRLAREVDGVRASVEHVDSAFAIPSDSAARDDLEAVRSDVTQLQIQTTRRIEKLREQVVKNRRANRKLERRIAHDRSSAGLVSKDDEVAFRSDPTHVARLASGEKLDVVDYQIRRISHVFDSVFYQERYGVWFGTIPDPVRHYVTAGEALGCLPSLDFSPRQYLNQFPECPRHLTALFDAIENHPHELDNLSRMSEYLRYRERYGKPCALDLNAQRDLVKLWNAPPLISVVVPVYKTDIQHLRELTASLSAQSYEHWELVLVDDASNMQLLNQEMSNLEASDERVTVLRRATNGGISNATNDGIAVCRGDYVAFVDHDDLLSQDALYWMASCARDQGLPEVVYSDHDLLNSDGKHVGPYFKPAFDEILLLQQNYINHLTMVRRETLVEVGGLDPAFDGSQDHELVLRICRHVPEIRIAHVPRVLYHWRAFLESGSFSDSNVPVAQLARIELARVHASEIGLPVEVRPGVNTFNCLSGTERSPSVSIIIPTRDLADMLERCVNSIFERTDYDNYEVVVVDNDSELPETFALFDKFSKKHGGRFRVVSCPGPFNFSHVNNVGASTCTSDLLLFLNNDTAVISSTWLLDMAAFSRLNRVGAVGAKLLYEDDRIQHAGVVLGMGGIAGHELRFLKAESDGYYSRAKLTRSTSVTTGACLLMRAELFAKVGGFDEGLPVAMNDVDLCVRLLEYGFVNVICSTAELYHYESVSRGSDRDGAQFARLLRDRMVIADRWGRYLEDDRAYNPNLELNEPGFHIALRPRQLSPRLEATLSAQL